MEIKAYIAGPDIVRSNAREYCDYMKKKCLEHGITPLHPMDNNQQGTPFKIYQQDVALIDGADIVIANFNSYAGALIDDGTAFECGYAVAKGKKVYGYTADDRYYGEKIPLIEGYTVKKSNQHINLMLEQSSTLVIGSFEDCLKRIEEDYKFDKEKVKQKN